MAGIEKWKKQKLIIDKAPNICYNVWCVKRNMSWSQQEARVRMRYKIIRTKLISRCGAEPRALGERAKTINYCFCEVMCIKQGVEGGRSVQRATTMRLQWWRSQRCRREECLK